MGQKNLRGLRTLFHSNGYNAILNAILKEKKLEILDYINIVVFHSTGHIVAIISIIKWT